MIGELRRTDASITSVKNPVYDDAFVCLCVNHKKPDPQFLTLVLVCHLLFYWMSQIFMLRNSNQRDLKKFAKREVRFECCSECKKNELVHNFRRFRR